MTVKIVDGKRVIQVKEGEFSMRMPKLMSALANGVAEEVILLDSSGNPEFSLRYLQSA